MPGSKAKGINFNVENFDSVERETTKDNSNNVNERLEQMVNKREEQQENCHKQIVTDRVVTNLHYIHKPLTKNNSNISPRNDNNKHDKNLISIFSILQCKQFNVESDKQHQQQLQLNSWHHHQMPSQPALLRPAIIIENFHKNLICIKQSLANVKLILITLVFACLLHLTQTSCRYEPSRSCEAICRRIRSPPIDNNYNQSPALSATSNVTTWQDTLAKDYNCTIRALVLMPDDERYVASLKRVVPILQVAEQRIHTRGLLPSFIQFDWMPQDDKCDAAFAAVKAMDGIVKNCSHVFFGPVCDYSLAAVGRIAKYFNSHGTPLISVGGSTFDFEKPKTKCSDEFYMLLRTGMLSFETISELTIAVMKSYKWSRSIFFYDADGQRNVAGQHTCYLMMTSLGKQMRNEHMTFAQYRITEKFKNRTEEMTREIGTKHSGK